MTYNSGDHSTAVSFNKPSPAREWESNSFLIWGTLFIYGY